MLKYIVIITTWRCDLSCLHCLQGHPAERADFPIELLPKLLKEARQFGANKVSLTGGEPHLHPQFEAIVETSVRAGYSWSIVSNGQQTTAYNAAIAKYGEQFSGISLSLDGAAPATHDTLRNRPGAFERVLCAIQNYLDQGVAVSTKTCLTRLNMQELDQIVRLGVDLGVSAMTFAGVIPTPWNRPLLLSDSEKLGLLQRIDELKDQTPIPLNVASALYTFGGVNFCSVLNLRSLYFNPRGEMIFCCDTSGYGAVVGDLAKLPLKDLIESWLDRANEIRLQRTRRIAQGQMGEGFDNCNFCNQYFDCLQPELG
jgi:MoaA/NifB/PqqE/SkfB family radical SAM enzyme